MTTYHRAPVAMLPTAPEGLDREHGGCSVAFIFLLVNAVAPAVVVELMGMRLIARWPPGVR